MIKLAARIAIEFAPEGRGIQVLKLSILGWASSWENDHLIETIEQMDVPLNLAGMTLNQLLLQKENAEIAIQVEQYLSAQLKACRRKK